MWPSRQNANLRVWSQWWLVVMQSTTKAGHPASPEISRALWSLWLPSPSHFLNAICYFWDGNICMCSAMTVSKLCFLSVPLTTCTPLRHCPGLGNLHRKEKCSSDSQQLSKPHRYYRSRKINYISWGSFHWAVELYGWHCRQASLEPGWLKVQ